MITDLFLDIIESLVGLVTGGLPESDPNAFSMWSTVVENLTALNYWLPIAEIFTFTLSIFVIAPFFLGMSLLAWIVAQVRGSSARG